MLPKVSSSSERLHVSPDGYRPPGEDLTTAHVVATIMVERRAPRAQPEQKAYSDAGQLDAGLNRRI